MHKNAKIQRFFQNVRLLSDKFGIVPLLYGSLGLEYLTGESLDADDIDILIPGEFVSERWPEFRAFLEENSYILTNEREHEFQKDDIRCAYAAIEELESFAGIRTSDIAVLEAGGVRFKLLSLQQYLRVYTTSMKDGYRAGVRSKKDLEKTAFIEHRLGKGE